MLRAVPLFALVVAGTLACDRDPDPPRGGVWQPCTDSGGCSDASLSCLEVFGAVAVTACLPTCVQGDVCASPPAAENGVPTTARCDADINAGQCVVDCASAAACPAGMLCFFDEVYTPVTNLGICAWPPP